VTAIALGLSILEGFPLRKPGHYHHEEENRELVVMGRVLGATPANLAKDRLSPLCACIGFPRRSRILVQTCPNHIFQLANLDNA
jgi:hypothetical protein